MVGKSEIAIMFYCKNQILCMWNYIWMTSIPLWLCWGVWDCTIHPVLIVFTVWHRLRLVLTVTGCSRMTGCLHPFRSWSKKAGPRQQTAQTQVPVPYFLWYEAIKYLLQFPEGGPGLFVISPAFFHYGIAKVQEWKTHMEYLIVIFLYLPL